MKAKQFFILSLIFYVIGLIAIFYTTSHHSLWDHLPWKATPYIEPPLQEGTLR